MAKRERTTPRRFSGYATLILAAALGVSVPLLADMSLDEYRDRGYVRGAFVNERPFGYIGRDGQPTGEAPAIAREILGRVGIGELRGALTEWPSLLPGLEAGRWDVITAGMYITPERCEQVVFSDPTYRVGQAFLVLAGNPYDLHSYDDLRDHPGLVLGVMDGAVEFDFARRAGIPERRIETIPNQAEMLSAVRGGRVDAVALSTLSIEMMAREGGDRVERTEPFDTPDYAWGYGGFAFRPADRDLRDAFNDELRQFVGTDEHLELIAEFGFAEDNLPAGVTADQLCAGEVP